MTTYSREQIEKTLERLGWHDTSIDVIVRELNRPAFEKKVGQIYCCKSKEEVVWRPYINAAGERRDLSGNLEYRRPNPKELGLDGKFSDYELRFADYAMCQEAHHHRWIAGYKQAKWEDDQLMEWPDES